jgi:cytochrome b561
VRRITSLLLLVVFLVLVITGLIMSSSHGPHGPGGPSPANLADDRPIGEDRPNSSFNPKEFHEFAGIVMLVLVLIHLALNFSIFMRYIGLKTAVKITADSRPS